MRATTAGGLAERNTAFGRRRLDLQPLPFEGFSPTTNARLADERALLADHEIDATTKTLGLLRLGRRLEGEEAL